MRPTGQQGRSLSPYVILAVVCAGVFVGALDQYVVVTALPSMMTDLEIPFTDLDRAAWIVIGYFLVHFHAGLHLCCSQFRS
jgi:hypothetical protein